MDEDTRQALNQLMLGVKAIAKSVERAVMTGTYEGTGDTLVRQYRSLHNKVSELMPDDFYVKELLTLVVDEDADDEQKAGQVRLLSEQMLDYMQGTLKAEHRIFIKADNVDELKDVGRELQDQILNVTKKALRRALGNLDLGFSDDDPPIPPVPPVPPAPPSAPIPPVPPMPPIRRNDEE